MQRSTDRFLTTHVGSLPRPDRLQALMRDDMLGKIVDKSELEAAIRAAVAEVVRKQIDTGLDIIDDGEQSKLGFIAYVNERLAGFEPYVPAQSSPFAGSKELRDFPEFYRWAQESHAGGPGAGLQHMVCRGPVSYKGQAQLERDLDNLKTALGSDTAREAFVPAASPATIEHWQKNEHYKTDKEFLYAIADAMREEYRAIIDAGFILQIDDPTLVMRYTMVPDETVEGAVKWGELRVDALNHALHGIPEDRVRYHTCYGINMGPRVWDLELKHIVRLILKIKAGAYSFEAANPRHEHEWDVWETVKLPDGKILIPGLITHSSVLVEHPELVAQRLLRFADIVGRENVIAGADCGFASNPAGIPEIHPAIAWAKLKALVDGARIASARPRRAATV